MTTLRRIEATDILLAGAYQGIVCFKFDETAMRFKNLQIFSGLCEDQMILDLRFFKNIIYYIGDKGESVGVIKFTKDVDMDSYRMEENSLNKKEYSAFAKAFDLKKSKEEAAKKEKEKEKEDEGDDEDEDEPNVPVLGRMRDVIFDVSNLARLLTQTPTWSKILTNRSKFTWR